MDYNVKRNGFSPSKYHIIFNSSGNYNRDIVNEVKKNFLIRVGTYKENKPKFSFDSMGMNLKYKNQRKETTDEVLKKITEMKKSREMKIKENIAQNNMMKNRKNIIELLENSGNIQSKSYRKDRSANYNNDNISLLPKKDNNYSNYNKIISSLEVLKKKL